MNCRPCFRLLSGTIFLLLIAGTSSVQVAAAQWKAGAAQVDITPKQFMWMSGYASRDRPADGKLTDLWSKALVLDDGAGHRGVLISLDLVGISREVAGAVCDQLKEKHGLARESIEFCTSHTHSGPVVAKVLRPMHRTGIPAEEQDRIHEYTKELIAKIVESVTLAIEKVAPAELRWGSGTTTFAVNRRTNKEAEIETIRAGGRIAGPSDHDVPVLMVYDTQGTLRAVTFGYACHATVLGLFQWCGDYPGYAQIELEKRHPGCIAMFWAGCGGDQNPLPRRTVELAQKYGKMLADAVDEVIATKGTPLTASLKPMYAEIPVTFAKIPTRDELEATIKSTNKYEVARAKLLLEQLDSGTPISSTYPYPVSSWKLGEEIEWYFLGGEVVVDYALRTKKELTGKKTWVAAYSNDVLAYIPSKRVLEEGGYEGGGAMVYYGHPSPWAPDIEELIMAEIHRQHK